MLGAEDVQGLQGGGEFLKIYKTVIILIKGLHQSDGVLLQVGVTFRSLLDLFDNGIH